LVERFVSGGQTVCDRAAFDAALVLGLPLGGWVPLGRLDEDGEIPDRYPNLRETDSSDPAVRSECNVRDSDATLLISHGPLAGGTALTQQLCERLGRPWLHVDLVCDSADEVRAWLARVRPPVLNIAGARHSEDPALYAAAHAMLIGLFSEGARDGAPLSAKP